MKLSDLKESTEITVGSYYVVSDWEWPTPVPGTTVLVTFVGEDEEERVVQFEYIDDRHEAEGHPAELEDYEWYQDTFERCSRPASPEEIQAFLDKKREIGKKFLDSLKNNDKEEE